MYSLSVSVFTVIVEEKPSLPLAPACPFSPFKFGVSNFSFSLTISKIYSSLLCTFSDIIGENPASPFSPFKTPILKVPISILFSISKFSIFLISPTIHSL